MSDVFDQPDDAATPLTVEEQRDLNGRHARLMADLLVMRLGGERFTWGSANLQAAGNVRQRYIAALQAADHHDIAPLLAFGRS